MRNILKAKNVPAAFILILFSIFLAATVIMVGAQEAAAVHGGTTDGVCMVDRYNATKPASVSSLNCTSNDVSLAIYEVVSGPTTCLEGEVIDVVLKGDFIATSAERWDVGVFIAQDGGTPNDVGGSCYSDYLHPVSADNTDLNLLDGYGPFYNGEITEDPGDLCGDIQQDNNATFITGALSIICQDNDNDFIADVTSCTVWANSRSDGTSLKPSCNDEADVTAETTAKCTCDTVNIIGIDFLEQAQIEVVKDLVPSDAPGLFNLQIDSSNFCEDGLTVCTVNSDCTGIGTETCVAIDVGDGGTTGPVLVGAGTQNVPGADHTVGETAGTGTNLSAYDISISCVDAGMDTFNGGPPLTFSGAGPLTVPVDPDDIIVCTITNTNLCFDAETRCDDQIFCTDDTCNPATGECINTPVADSTPCEDGSFCTSETGVPGTPDHCESGSCVGIPVNCGPGDQCNTNECNEATDQCEFVPKADSTPCEDGSFCTSETGVPGTPDHCESGSCVGIPVNCGPGDQCNTNECNEATDQCEFVPKADSTPCEDGSFCTSETGAPQTPDHCESGSCVGIPVDCGPGDQCNDDVCNDDTDACEVVPKADSTPCEDGSFCTSETGAPQTPDHCESGSCVGIPVDCGPGDQCNDDVCNDDTDACEVVPKADSTPCEDGSFCTSETGAPQTPDHCESGSCVGIPVDCGPGDQCNDDVCNDDTDACEVVPKADSTPCEDGSFCTSETGAPQTPDHCESGSCVGIPVDCGPGDQCNDDVCNDDTDACEVVPKADSTPCEDGDFCTSETAAPGTPDHCESGSCVGIPVDCGPGDQCNTNECNEDTDACEFVPVADSTPCEDGDFCTSETGTPQTPDHCFGGVCTGVPVDCSSEDDDCNVGTCDLTDGACFPDPLPEDTACGDDTDNDCTDPDTCDGEGNCLPNNEECAFVTDSSLCPFDVDPGACGTDDPNFRVVFTPDMQNWPAYKQNSTNPGQYYYNLIKEGSAGDTVRIVIPWPFVTQGATPVHVYDGSVPIKDGCFEPCEDCALSSEGIQISLDDWALGGENATGVTCDQECGPDGMGNCWFDVELPMHPDYDNCNADETCSYYVNVHLDWGLKGPNVDANPCDDMLVDRYDVGAPNYASNNALVNDTEDTGLSNCRTFDFCHDGTIIECTGADFSDSVQNINEFKKVRGFGGMVLTVDDDPVPGAEVELYDSAGVWLDTMITDADGWYLSEYVHKGKEASYTLCLQAGDSYVGDCVEDVIVGKSVKYGEGNFFITPSP